MFWKGFWIQRGRSGSSGIGILMVLPPELGLLSSGHAQSGHLVRHEAPERKQSTSARPVALAWRLPPFLLRERVDILIGLWLLKNILTSIAFPKRHAFRLSRRRARPQGHALGLPPSQFSQLFNNWNRMAHYN